MSIFKITRENRIVLIAVLSISIISFAIAYLYYSGINKSEDPRVVETKFMFGRYDASIRAKNYDNAFSILDSIEHILTKLSGYSDSYELGIIYNNRASIYISKALYEEKDSIGKKLLLDTAFVHTNKCVEHYNKWIERFGKLSEADILSEVKPHFLENDDAFKGKRYQKILSKRVKDIILAQKETPRRLSVAYTNLGIIQRHTYMQTKAIESYITAIKLWKENPAALSNLNVLYGKPSTDRSIFEKLFPPDKNK
ncbi:MAG: hypothetical protein EHM93_12405 [Bacteroidales bacterium]|nr:MAG: hypothetical protein EHM93_12405 [Bacteroidales bacterium]